MKNKNGKAKRLRKNIERTEQAKKLWPEIFDEEKNVSS